MRIEDRLEQAIKALNQSTETHAISTLDVISLIDLTLLDDKATSDQINNLVAKANQHQVAAICVLPQHLQFISKGSIRCATVVNFPTGNQSADRVLEDIHQLINKKLVDEIDYVFPYQLYLQGQEELALTSCERCYQLCKKHIVTFKVILETAAFPSLEKIYQASLDVIGIGCDFLKTSTGKIEGGASIPAAFSILSAIKDTKLSCGIKLSGGIKTLEQACIYIQLAQFILNKPVENGWFRLGASDLLDDIITQTQSVHN